MSWIFATGVVFQPANDRQYLRVSLYTSSNLHRRTNIIYAGDDLYLMIFNEYLADF